MFLCHGEIVVVETDEEQLLGTAEVADGTLVVRSGFVGRPTIVAFEDVESVTPASGHPDVETDLESALAEG